MPVVQVQNKTKGSLVLSESPTSPSVIWEGEGDPSGLDLQMVSAEFADSPAFYRAVQKGLLTIVNPEDNPELQEKINAQNNASLARSERFAQVAQESMDQSPNNDILQLDCIAPSGVGKCGNPVPVKEREKNAKPPLCSIHIGNAHEYVPEHTQAGGLTVVNWLRATMTERQRQEF